MRFGRTSAGSKAWSGKLVGQGRGRAQRRGKTSASVRAGFWVKVKRQAAKLPFAEDLLAAYYCAFDRETPLQVRAVLLGALAYFVLPFDGIPDVLPVLGFTDDAAVLADRDEARHRQYPARASRRGAAQARRDHLTSSGPQQDRLAHDLARGDILQRLRGLGQRINRVHMR